LGDANTAAEGKKEKDEDRAQSAVGHIKDAAREIAGKKIGGVGNMGRALLLWLLGIPIPVLIVLYLFHVI
jgi:hypothetical protein